LKPLYWIGFGIAILLSLAVYFFGLFGTFTTLQAVEQMFSTIFLLVGLWTLVAAFALVEVKDRTFFALWGVILSCVSLFAYVPANYAIGILLVALVVLILLVYFSGRFQKEFTTATHPPNPAGDTPAAV
jgi:hypothetical protein